MHRRRACSRPTIPTGSVRWSTRCCDYDHFMVAADFDAYWQAQRPSMRCGASRRLVAHEHPQHGADGLVLVRPRPSANMPTRSGSVPMRGDASLATAPEMSTIMEALFIGQTYIDVTFLTDHIPAGDEKSVASRICGVVRRQCGDGGVLLRQARHQARPDRDRSPTTGSAACSSTWRRSTTSRCIIRKVRESSLSFIMPQERQARDRALPRRSTTCILSAARSRRLPGAASRRPPGRRRDASTPSVPRGRHPHLARRRRGAHQHARVAAPSSTSPSWPSASASRCT